MSDENEKVKKWVPPENPEDWDLRDKVEAEKAGLSQLIPGTYEWKVAYWGRTGEYPKAKAKSAEERLKAAEESAGRENIQRAAEERKSAAQDRYKDRMIALAKSRFGVSSS